MLGRRLPFSFVLVAAAALSLAAGCSPAIGDSCTASADCDVNGTRTCDLAEPGGYCTIPGCDVGTCPAGEASCVQFRSDEPRLTESFCMFSCESDSDCRTDEGYACITAAQASGVILDGPTKFCAIPPAAP